jgi:tRNA (cmo5U34)-methyltransferase
MPDSWGGAVPPGDTGPVWRQAGVISHFLTDVRAAMPLADAQLDVLRRVVRARQPRFASFLDLGCGDGILGRTLLAERPEAVGVFLDFAPPMLAAARTRLAEDAHRHRFIEADLGDAQWTSQIAAWAPFDIVLSGFAIHHLPDASKRSLYADVFGLLEPGGMFLNLEHVSSVAPWAERAFDECFVDSLFERQARSGGTASRAEIETEFAARPDKAANILAPVEEQCRWLKEIGFVEVDCHFRVLELALFGGIRPEVAPPATSPSTTPALQDRHAPHGRCFGCGPMNARGLRIKSHVSGDEVVADWMPETQHESVPGVLNGGIIGVLFDCHSNWTAAWSLMQRHGTKEPPVTVTAEYAVRLRRPTPTARPVRLRARATEIADERATIEATLESDGVVTATFRGVFVAVRPGHPAHGAWSAGGLDRQEE